MKPMSCSIQLDEKGDTIPSFRFVLNVCSFSAEELENKF